MASQNDTYASQFLRSPMWCDRKTCAAAGEGDRRLQLGAARQHRDRRGAAATVDRRRARSRGAAQQRTARRVDAAHHRVVDADVDRPVVAEDAVGDAAEPRAGRRRRGRRSARRTRSRDVSTIGSPTAARSRWCSGVYGSITPSSATPGATAGATGASGRRGPARSAGAGDVEQVGAAVVELDEPARRGHVGGHQRERLVLAVLAGAQRGDGARPTTPARRGGSRRGP